jgi:hypothetical protein
MEEKKHILAKLAPLLIIGGVVVFVWAFYTGIMTVEVLIDGVIAGLVGALAMSVAMMMVQKTGKMQLMVPKLVSSNIGLENMWMGVHFFTGISFALGYIIIAGILSFSLSILGATVFALLGPEMFLGLVILPDNGLGMFGKNKGMMMPMMTVIMHIIFGVFMGGTLVYLA